MSTEVGNPYNDSPDGAKDLDVDLEDKNMDGLLKKFIEKRSEFIGLYLNYKENQAANGDDYVEPASLMFNLLSETEFEAKYNNSWETLWYARNTSGKDRAVHGRQGPQNKNNPTYKSENEIWDDPTSHVNSHGLTEIYTLGDIRNAEAPAGRHQSNMVIDAMTMERQLLGDVEQAGSTPSYPQPGMYVQRRDEESQKLMSVLGIDGGNGDQRDQYNRDVHESGQASNQVKSNDYQEYYKHGMPQQQQQQDPYMAQKETPTRQQMNAQRLQYASQQQYLAQQMQQQQQAYLAHMAKSPHQQQQYMDYYNYQQQQLYMHQQRQAQILNPQYRQYCNQLQQQYYQQQQLAHQQRQQQYQQQQMKAGQQPTAMTPGMSQPGMSQPGMSQPGMSQPGMSQPGMSQPGMSQPQQQQDPATQDSYFNQQQIQQDAMLAQQRAASLQKYATMYYHHQQQQQQQAQQQHHLQQQQQQRKGPNE